MTGLREVYLAQAHAREHGDHWAGPPEMVETIAALAGTKPGDHVLDVGTGVGGPARRLAALVECRVTAIDLLEPVVRVARARSAGRRGRLHFLSACAESLPFRAGSFDQVWCLGVVAHVQETRTLASEIARVLRPGGRACFTEAFFEGDRRPRFEASAPKPWHPLPSRALAAALRAGGFEDVDVLPWPGRQFSADANVFDPNLRSDLLKGRLVSRLLLAARP